MVNKQELIALAAVIRDEAKRLEDQHPGQASFTTHTMRCQTLYMKLCEAAAASLTEAEARAMFAKFREAWPGIADFKTSLSPTILVKVNGVVQHCEECSSNCFHQESDDRVKCNGCGAVYSTT